MQYDFTVNPAMTAQVLHVGRERQPVVILDDFMRSGQSLVELAATVPFSRPPSHYPGLVAPLHPDYVSNLLSAIRPFVRDTFGLVVDRPPRLYSCFYGVATIRPEQLSVGQRHPHIDTPDPGRLAVLHYLCDESHGGTSFYRDRATGLESMNAQQLPQFMERMQKDTRENGPLPAGYMEGANRLYERTEYIAAKFNRLLLYRSRVLHSASISKICNFSANPRSGRLTANVFLEFACP